uniref:PEHE domain-containing protein n=1 Tax=Anopheles maculatus TaxID=74869 RepID=A0A182SWE0_9DIPT
SGYAYDGSRSGSNGHRNNKNQAAGVCKSRKSSHCYDNYDGNDGMVSRSRNTSPTPNNRNERRYRNSSAFDIGSIVIPQSMAASTRVSLPQYKDIAVPKWRIVGDQEDAEESFNSQLNSSDMVSSNDQNILLTIGAEGTEAANANVMKTPVKSDAATTTIPPNGTKTAPSTSSAGYMVEAVQQQQQQLIVIPAQDEEDISDEAIMLKHDRALQEERKKFRTYLKFPWSRPRAKRRTDSRAGSSGGNTPDPTSPAPPTPMVEHDSSPACPSTPITPQDGQELSEANVINGN